MLKINEAFVRAVANYIIPENDIDTDLTFNMLIAELFAKDHPEVSQRISDRTHLTNNQLKELLLVSLHVTDEELEAAARRLLDDADAVVNNFNKPEST